MLVPSRRSEPSSPWALVFSICTNDEAGCVKWGGQLVLPESWFSNFCSLEHFFKTKSNRAAQHVRWQMKIELLSAYSPPQRLP